MPDSVTFDTKGFEELRRTFRRLPVRVADKAVKSAVRAGANPIVKATRAGIQSDTGSLAKSMRAKVKTYKASGTTVAIIGARNVWLPIARSVRWTKTGRINPALYAHLADKGFRTKVGRGKSRYGRRIPGRNFMRRGFTSSVASSRTRFSRFLGRAVEREARKLGFR